MNRLVLIVFMALVPQWLLAQSVPVAFSRSVGFYEHGFSLSLDCASPYQIRYTLNGNEPTSSSFLYERPLEMDALMYSKSNIYTIVDCIPSVYHPVDDVERIIVVRAAAFDSSGICVGPVSTQSYIIGDLGCDTHGLPVMSIATDSLSLFDYETGIFVPGANYNPMDTTGSGNYNLSGREWERRVNVEFYETDNTGINQQCGLRTHGGASRWYQQKGMRLYARDEYGKKRFKHAFFENTAVANFKRLNLHPFRCSNWWQTGGQEYLSQRVASQLDVDGLGVRQVVVFINGEYWGIYTLEESPDERYLEDHYDVDIEQVNIIKYWVLTNYGDGVDWWGFRNWMQTADLSQPADSAYAFSRMDIPSFIDYFLLETFGANLDWPQNNVLQWQAATGEPFRMMFFDGDGCFTRWYYPALYNAMHVGNNSLIINKLLENNGFVSMLYSRYIELKTSAFHYHRMKALWEDYRGLVEDEVPMQSCRFGFPANMQRWQSDMDSTEAFFVKRFKAFNEELQEMLSLDDVSEANLAVYPNPSSGHFYIGLQAEECALVPVEITDLLGRRVFSASCFMTPGVNAVPFSVPLRSGMYFLRVGSVLQKIIIE